MAATPHLHLIFPEETVVEETVCVRPTLHRQHFTFIVDIRRPGQHLTSDLTSLHLCPVLALCPVLTLALSSPIG